VTHLKANPSHRSAKAPGTIAVGFVFCIQTIEYQEIVAIARGGGKRKFVERAHAH
jgi:hypothetical protein